MCQKTRFIFIFSVLYSQVDFRMDNLLQTRFLKCISYLFSVMAGTKRITFTRNEKYSDHVAEELKQIRSDRDFTDFKISINDQDFPCHKVVVAIHSPMLKALLKSEMSEVAKQSMNLNHMDIKIFRIIYDYMYYEHISFDSDQLMDLLKASDYLQIKQLKEMCVDEIQPSWSLLMQYHGCNLQTN